MAAEMDSAQKSSLHFLLPRLAVMANVYIKT